MFKIAKEEHGFTKLSDLNTLKGGAIGESYHVILLVKSQEGWSTSTDWCPSGIWTTSAVARICRVS